MTLLPALLRRPALVAAALAAVVDAASAQDTSPPERTTLDGVFTEAQAARGETTFDANCASCHGLGDFFGPAFERGWEGYSVGDMFELVSTTMPEDQPGALDWEQYVDVLTYLLSQNGAPSGPEELPTEPEPLATITIRFPPR